MALDLYGFQALFLFDMILQFCSAYPKGGGTLELDPQKIALQCGAGSRSHDLWADPLPRLALPALSLTQSSTD